MSIAMLNIFIGLKAKLRIDKNRIIPSEGYVRVNIVAVCDIVNRLKSDASLDDMKKILSF